MIMFSGEATENGHLRTIAVALVIIAALHSESSFGDNTKPAKSNESDLAEYKASVRPVLAELCFECHSTKKQEGDVRLDVLDPDLVNGSDEEIWHDALNRINLGEMPPPKSKQPTAGQSQLLVEWLTGALRRASEARRYADGRIVTRRLTRYEYQNTMRDLLNVTLDFTRELPPEPVSVDGFLNNSSTLEMSPVQLEAYLNAARSGLQEAIVSGKKPRVFKTNAKKTAVGKLPTKAVAGHVPAKPEFLLDIKEFPRHGEFEIRIRAGAVVPEGHDYPRLQLWLGCQPGIIHVPRKLVGEVDVTATPDAPETYVFRGRIEDFPQPGDVPFGNVAFNGMLALIDFLDADGKELRYSDRTYAVPPATKKGKKNKNKKEKAKATDQSTDKAESITGTEKPRCDVVVELVEFEAPLISSWPPKSHTRILPTSENSQDERRYVREVLGPFMSRAFRRPVAEEEVEQTLQLFETIRPLSPSFEEALRETLASVLISPHFLYIVEPRDELNSGEQLNAFELATRLSYFLWSSMPDEELFDVARSGRLTEVNGLSGQVERMMRDERFDQFIERFAEQWFGLDALDRVAVNPEFYPDFDNAMKDEMRKESLAMFAEVVKADLSCLNLIDSDWTMLNRALANHYGMTGPRSSQFERVALSEKGGRGGVLGQAAFLLSNANGESSHPIKRAVWLLDRFLDSPPAPPPPDVPELDAESADLAGLSLKEQLKVHRDKEACANCHRGIDPWGVAFENYDAIGQWRDAALVRSKAKLAKSAVDSSSMLPDGTKISGLTELKDYLLTNRKEQFARSVVKRVATYGLGRSLDFGDRGTVHVLSDRFMENDFQIKLLLVDFITSDMFRTK